MSYGDTLQGLLREGAIALYHDYRSGCAYDLSGNSNDGALASGVSWAGHGIFCDNTSANVSVADSVSIQLVEGALLLFGDFRSFTNTVEKRLFSKRDVGGTNYDFRATASALVLYDGSATRTLNGIDTNSLECIAINMGDGTISEGFGNGNSLGDFNAASSISVDNADLQIGNGSVNTASYLDSPIKAALIFNRKLTATEHAQLYSDLVYAQWPSKFTSFAKRRQLTNSSDSGIVSGWDMQPVDGEVVDNVGGNNGTILSGTYGSGILGDRMLFDPSAGSDAITTALSIIHTADHTWSFWAKVNSAGNVTFIGASNVNGIQIRTSGTNIQILDAGSGGSDYTTTSSPLVYGQTHHITVTWVGSTGAVEVFVDGVSAGSGTVNTASYDTSNMYIGASYNGQTLDGEMTDVEVFSTIKSDAWVAAKYLEGAKAVQFKTDWGYQVSPANEGGVLHQQIGTRSSPWRAGDTTGRWSIETDTINGRLCKVLVCKTAGKIYIPSSLFFDTTENGAAYGTCNFWFRKSAATNVLVYIIGDSFETGGVNGYMLNFAANERIWLLRVTAGVSETLFYTDIGEFPAEAWTQVGTTRLSELAVYMDGLLVGNIASGTNPVTDTTHQTSKGILFSMGTDDKISLGDVQGNYSFSKQLGVVVN